MSKTFSKIRLTADNGSVDEFLWTNSVGTKDELEYTDGYQNFIEDNPEAHLIEVEVTSYLCGDGEADMADEDDIKEFEKLGDDFIGSDEVEEIEYSKFDIFADSEDIDEGSSFDMGSF